MKFIIFLFTALLVFPLLLSSAELKLSQEEKIWIQEHPLIKVSNEDDWPPFDFSQEGQARGYSVDILKKLAQIIGIELEFVNGYTWRELLEEFDKKNIDLMHSITKTQDREEKYIFSKGYMPYKMSYLLRDNNRDIHSSAELHGKKIAVGKEWFTTDIIKNMYPTAEVIEFENSTKMLEALSTSKVDALIDNFIVANYLMGENFITNIKHGGFLELQGKKEEQFYFCANKENAILINLLNKANKLLTTQDKRKIQKKWFSNHIDETTALPSDTFLYPTLELTEKEKEYIKNKKLIKMCIDPDWMPLEKFDKDGKHIGMTADFFEAFQKEMNIPIQAIQTKTWSESLELAKARKCDIFSLAMQTQERKEYMNFTMPYITIPLVLATKLDVAFIDNIKYIKREKIGIMKGYAFNEIIKREYPNIEVVDIENLKDGLQQVANGKLFGVVDTLVSVGYLFQTNFIGELKIAGKFDEKWELGIGVRNDDMILYDIFQKAVQNLSGEFKQKVLNRYIAIRYESYTDYTLLLQVFFILLFIIAIVLYHNRKLSKINNKMTHLQEELKEQAQHDALTKLPNRTLFNDRLEQAIENAKRKHKTLALLFIDLDHFKEINDSLGHDYGDEILKVTSSRLKEVVRDKDTVARLGGDEFTIILEELTQAQDASLIAEKIIKTLSEPTKIKGNTLYISSSIGISIYPDDGTSSVNLLKYADSAMYKAKDEGRNNYQYYNATMTELAFERVVMETSLRIALKNEEFVVYYQPQINAASDTLIGLEALVRWKHSTMGIVSPDKFISLAESTGLIVELDRLVMKIAMTQLTKWYEDGFNPGILAMNLSVNQLKQKDFIEVLQTLFTQTKCRPEWIELEVTESQIMSNPEEAIKILHQISAMGVGLAIDDFGTGYSSLAYLKKLPINKLKIDQTFIRDLPQDEEDVGITKAVIALAHSLNLKVIAEGVESKEQRDFLVKNGCQDIQGYFYSKPLPSQELEAIL